MCILINPMAFLNRDSYLLQWKKKMVKKKKSIAVSQRINRGESKSLFTCYVFVKGNNYDTDLLDWLCLRFILSKFPFVQLIFMEFWWVMCGAEFLQQARPNAYDNDHSNYKHNRRTLPQMRCELLLKGSQCLPFSWECVVCNSRIVYNR